MGKNLYDTTFKWGSLGQLDMSLEILHHEPKFFTTKYGSIKDHYMDAVYKIEDLLMEIPINEIIFRLTIDEAIELHLTGDIKLPYDFSTEYNKPEIQALENLKNIQKQCKLTMSQKSLFQNMKQNN